MKGMDTKTRHQEYGHKIKKRYIWKYTKDIHYDMNRATQAIQRRKIMTTLQNLA